MSDLPPPPPPPPSPGGAPGGLVPVGTWPRFGARFIDFVVLLIPSLLISLVVGGTGNTFTGEVGFRSFLAGIVSTFVTFLYFAYLESTRGQTVGKMALGYKVVGADGNAPTFEVAAKRNAWLLLSLIPLIGGLAQLVLMIVIAITINSDPFHRGWHDNFAGGSAVIRAK